MNLEFIHKDNQALIKDEHGNYKKITYYDNLENVLIHENILEHLNIELKECLNKVKNYKDNDIDEFIPVWTSLLILLTHLETKYLLYAFRNLSESIDKDFYSILKIFLYSSSLILSLLIGGDLDFIDYINIKDKRGTKLKLEYLKKLIEQEKLYIKELEKNKTISKNQIQSDMEVKKINSKDIMDEIYDKLDMYYKLGYKEKRLYKKYLKDKLNKNYSDEFKEIIKEHFNEKEKVLEK